MYYILYRQKFFGSGRRDDVEYKKKNETAALAHVTR